MSFLSHLEWRYATKKFDTSKKVSHEDLEKILQAIRMTPTSYGLQAYHFYVVSDPKIVSQTQEAAYKQIQIGTASHLIVMCARNDLMQAKDDYFNLMSAGDAEVRASLAGFEQMVENTVSSPNALEWAKKQVYIALGFALAACAELQIDSCPMEGLDPKAVAEILNLPANLDVALLLPIGYRAFDEVVRPKVRFAKEKLFTVVE